MKVNELISAGGKVSEKEKLNYMLNTFPESYSYIDDLIHTLKEADQTADYIRNKIKLAEMKNQGEYGEKFEHFARACQDGGQSGQQSGTAKRHMARPDTWSRPRQRRKEQLQQRAQQFQPA